MKFPGNCLLVALVMGLRPGRRIRVMRNRGGRLHFFWTHKATGEAFEFYTKGASRRSYLRNAITMGEVRRAPGLDEKRHRLVWFDGGRVLVNGTRENGPWTEHWSRVDTYDRNGKVVKVGEESVFMRTRRL